MALATCHRDALDTLLERSMAMSQNPSMTPATTGPSVEAQPAVVLSEQLYRQLQL
jgi:hypothetical protein